MFKERQDPSCLQDFIAAHTDSSRTLQRPPQLCELCAPRLPENLHHARSQASLRGLQRPGEVRGRSLRPAFHCCWALAWGGSVWSHEPGQSCGGHSVLRWAPHQAVWGGRWAPHRVVGTASSARPNLGRQSPQPPPFLSACGAPLPSPRCLHPSKPQQLQQTLPAVRSAPVSCLWAVTQNGLHGGPRRREGQDPSPLGAGSKRAKL